MDSAISEFSYGYALTDELVHAAGSAITGAPVFPSLYDEGQKGGGWDVKLSRPGVPLFLQFKLSHFMKTGHCKEQRSGKLSAPCYRAYLRPSRFSKQHSLLLELERKGQEVYYSAPAFHLPEELDDAYANGKVRARSLWFKPSTIGDLPDDRSHHVSFNDPFSAWFFFSEPAELSGERDYASFERRIVDRVRRDGERLLSPAALETLAEDVADVSQQRRDRALLSTEAGRRLSEAPPLARAAYMAATFLESQLIILHLRESSSGR